MNLKNNVNNIISVKKICIGGMLIALSVLFANVKIFGTIAFDAVPGFLGSLLFGGTFGGLVGALGHLATATTSGFPFGVLIHITIAVTMFISVYGFWFTKNRLDKTRLRPTVTLTLASIVGVLLNAPITLFVLSLFLGKTFFVSMIVPLLIGSIANILLCDIVYVAVKDKIDLN